MSNLESKKPGGRRARLIPGEPSPWKPLKERKSDREAKSLSVVEAATRLFLERGVHRATMSEIAQHLNITKPALYNYFHSKDSILSACIQLADRQTSQALANAEALDARGFDKVRAFITEYVSVSTTAYGACLNRIDDRDLEDAVREQLRSVNRIIDHRVRALIAAGVADGSIVECDVRLTTFAIMGAIQWISRWYRHDGPLSPEEIAAEYSKRLMASLTPPKETVR